METKPRACGDCHTPIPTNRLRAIPDAQYCVGCQPAHDTVYDVFTHNSRLLHVLAVGAVFHPDDLNELRGVSAGGRHAA